MQRFTPSSSGREEDEDSQRRMMMLNNNNHDQIPQQISIQGHPVNLPLQQSPFGFAAPSTRGTEAMQDTFFLTPNMIHQRLPPPTLLPTMQPIIQHPPLFPSPNPNQVSVNLLNPSMLVNRPTMNIFPQPQPNSLPMMMQHMPHYYGQSAIQSNSLRYAPSAAIGAQPVHQVQPTNLGLQAAPPVISPPALYQRLSLSAPSSAPAPAPQRPLQRFAKPESGPYGEQQPGNSAVSRKRQEGQATSSLSLLTLEHTLSSSSSASLQDEGTEPSPSSSSISSAASSLKLKRSKSSMVSSEDETGSKETEFNGEGRLHIKFESFGNVPRRNPPRIANKGVIPNGIAGSFSSYNERWHFRVVYAGQKEVRNRKMITCIEWQIRNSTWSSYYSVLENINDAMKREQRGITLCNRVFTEALEQRAKEYELDVAAEKSKSIPNQLRIANYESRIKLLRPRRISEGPLMFGLRHRIVQERNSYPSHAANSSSGGVRDDADSSSSSSSPPPTSHTADVQDDAFEGVGTEEGQEGHEVESKRDD